MHTIWITFTSERLHRWPSAPQNLLHDHLRNTHRHLMHVRVEIVVDETDREVSFEQLRLFSQHHFEQQVPAESPMSCEQMASLLGDALQLTYDFTVLRVDVSEDGESGASWQPEAGDRWQPDDEPPYGS